MSPALLVGIPADRKQIGPHPFHVVGEKYILAAIEGAELTPVLIPALGGVLQLEAILERLAGLILTGATSNIEPHHYSEEPSWEGNEHDPHRDATTLPLVSMAIAMDLPLLALCRGFQEVNVALGGTLHQKVHEAPGLDDHRENPGQPLAEQYGPSHSVRLAPGGLLRRLSSSGEVMVNSLHGQGIRTLAPGLVAEAWAPDGLVEAARLDRPDRFLVGVQWHPEWQVMRNPFYLEIFKAFGAACRERAAGHC
jgi:putative glutamine amidotransferase